MKTLQSAILILCMALMFTTCKNDETSTQPQAGTGVISGVVTDAVTNSVISNVSITAQNLAGGVQTTTTDAQGKFTVSFSVDSVTSVTLLLTHVGYRDTIVAVSRIRSGDLLPLAVHLVSTLPAGPGIITGLVQDYDTWGPLAGIKVKTRSKQIAPESTLTDAAGRYSITFPIDSTIQGGLASIDMSVKAPGYRDTTFAATVRFGVSTSIPIRLFKKTAALLIGTVTDVTNSGVKLSGVTISVQGAGIVSQSDTTDLLGRYRLSFALDTSAITVVRFSKVGYRDTTTIVEIFGATTTTLNFVMRQAAGGGGTAGGSGLAQTIAFAGADPQEVSVYGVGGRETAVLGWEVRDSLGLPIDLTHAVKLTFTLLNGPNGGEYVSPPVLTTDGAGKVSTTFNAGTRAGVVQVVATTTVGGRTITSNPVRVIINGGFPVQPRFSIAAPYYNFPGLDWQGRNLPVTVLVGDVYSNPVVQNTAVYFRSGAGVIQPSVFTDKNGQGSVSLISGNPYPFGIYAAPSPLDTGYSYVVAKTIGQNGATVSDSILLLWSGKALIRNLTPTTFSIDSAGSQTFNFTVSDRLGHPLAAGTKIVVTAQVPEPPDPNSQVNKVLVAFAKDGSLELEDHLFRGPGSTDFSFKVSDGNTRLTIQTRVVITIAVSGPNGTAIQTIDGLVY